MVGWVGPRTEGPFPRGFRPAGALRGWLRTLPGKLQSPPTLTLAAAHLRVLTC